MYKRSIEYFSHPAEIPDRYSPYIGPKQIQQRREMQHFSRLMQHPQRQNPSKRALGNYPLERIRKTFPKDLPLKAHWSTSGRGRMHAPSIWGPAFWFSLHNGAIHYPVEASRNHRERMKNFILAIPVMIPCIECKTHASDFLEMNKGKLDQVCQGRDNLFNFFVDFHNVVNRRLGKKIMSHEQAYALYNDGKAPHLTYH